LLLLHRFSYFRIFDLIEIIATGTLTTIIAVHAHYGTKKTCNTLDGHGKENYDCSDLCKRCSDVYFVNENDHVKPYPAMITAVVCIIIHTVYLECNQVTVIW